MKKKLVCLLARGRTDGRAGGSAAALEPRCSHRFLSGPSRADVGSRSAAIAGASVADASAAPPASAEAAHPRPSWGPALGTGGFGSARISTRTAGIVSPLGHSQCCSQAPRPAAAPHSRGHRACPRSPPRELPPAPFAVHRTELSRGGRGVTPNSRGTSDFSELNVRQML